MTACSRLTGTAPDFTIVPMSETHAYAICGWHYEPPYHIYQWKPWAELIAGREEFADPLIRDEQYVSAMLSDGTLAAYGQFFPLGGWTRLGLGMHPAFCGQGWGLSLVCALVREAKRRRPDCAVDLEVLSWNERAVKTYGKAGFVISDEYERPTPQGTGHVYCMVYRENSDS